MDGFSGLRSVVAYLLGGLLCCCNASAAEEPTTAINWGDAYHVVFQFETTIDRPAEVIWPHLIDLGSWIDFDLIHVSGPRGGEGEIFRLYEGQDFFLKTTKIIPNKLWVGANISPRFRGEDSTGIGLLKLTEIDDKTVVSSIMSRSYLWTEEGPNPTEATRRSEAFIESTRASWEEQFFPRLKELVATAGDPDARG